MIKDLGTFEVVSGRIVLSDPCYDLSTWCQIRDLPAKNGIWQAWAEVGPSSWGNRVHRIWAHHQDHFVGVTALLDQEPIEGQVGVDSGQAGIFDQSHYQDDSVVPAGFEGEIRPEEKWYSLNCSKTCVERPNPEYAAERARYDQAFERCHGLTDEAEIKAAFEALRDIPTPRRVLGELSADVIPFGCVASSGFGDGGYNAYGVNYDGGTTYVALGIDFIPAGSDDPVEEEKDPEPGDNQTFA